MRYITEFLIVEGCYKSKKSQLGKVVFEDGTTLIMAEVDALAQTYNGNDDNEIVKAGDVSNDIIYGNGGNDTLYGYEGNDTLDGGTGSD